MSNTFAALLLGGAAVIETAAALVRGAERRDVFARAYTRSLELRRPLVVVGDPDAGAWTSTLGREYGCGSLCLDLTGCPGCPVAIPADVTRGPIAGVPTDSAVVYVSCVLEYVTDPQAGWREIMRMAGSASNVFMVTVQPWTVTASLYPGARSLLYHTPGSPILRVEPVTMARKLAVGGTLSGLAAMSIG